MDDPTMIQMRILIRVYDEMGWDGMLMSCVFHPYNEITHDHINIIQLFVVLFVYWCILVVGSLFHHVSIRLYNMIPSDFDM